MVTGEIGHGRRPQRKDAGHQKVLSEAAILKALRFIDV
ncbi:hypothetical protein [Polaromonas sp. CG9_12]|nr:hypothetical protein [Polaromonas sp. CG9_12]